ncbi:MAG: hypothetical protein AAY43_13150 [Methanosarcina sp. 795]|jgi:hypothetical protein|uniref:hypothetical protein n=1 Tax=Methanosarcina thermophila TaxID=2210 RepID=UPI00064FC5C2|nr:hypothetical protein [Methanosarcina thermophila]ALK06444.1 MAG: hypothetical protein AAY43_13150 [Methanosarcina sp. 795]NLU55899.1 hypothetical protein [Methanosarcina thermophila]HOA69794.1 hypothetical protein [Methanosarcina thermophila]HOQ65385.1 hypothetical protein [Methanosarcina thermophila]HPT82002.1 hypothetical protein [Methanosarcina thermophila]
MAYSYEGDRVQVWACSEITDVQQSILSGYRFFQDYVKTESLLYNCLEELIRITACWRFCGAHAQYQQEFVPAEVRIKRIIRGVI